MSGKARGHLQIRFPDKDRTVLQKARAVKIRRGGTEHAVRHHQPQRGAGGNNKIIAVNAAHHTFPLGLEGFGHGAEGGFRKNGISVADHRGDVFIGFISYVVFSAESGVSIAPENLGFEVGVCR
ncbi:hypothetical protein SDC9_59944 [bioreactor metagenome]|uniref:Uncharacterized protein n=1 Tax=bioreactor metagenome TaxID=1076179 RepID=A0A644XCG0_9ZZZZ